MKTHPKKFWLIPKTIGYECRTFKPEVPSIEVVHESEVAALRAELLQLRESLGKGKDRNERLR